MLSLTLYRPLYWATFDAELSNLRVDEELVRRAGTLGSIPLVVVSGKPDVGRLPPDIGCTSEELIASYQAGQVELTHLSTDSTQVDCTECGHYIPLAQPQVAVDAIRQALGMVK